MLTDKEFLSFINDESLDGSLEENLGRLIDEEMEKSEKEMDTELIEYCLDELSKLQAQKQNTEEKKGNGEADGKRIKPKYKKIIAVAAAIAALLAGTLSASAYVFDVKLFDGVVELYNDYIRINFDKTDNKSENYELLDTDLAKELSDNGFDEVLLPEAIFSGEYEITGIEYELGENLKTAGIAFEIKNKQGGVYISKYSMDELVPEYDYMNVTGDIKEVIIGNITAYCFMQGDKTAITYRDGLAVYYIQIPMDLDDATEFAKTIK